MQLRILGPVEVTQGNGPIPLGGAKQRAVLAHLLLRANHLVPTDVLIDGVWGEEPPEAARNSLQSYASHLRKALGDGRLEGSRAGYVLHADPSEVDAFRFQSLLRDARRLLAIEPKAAIRALDEALALWRGPAFADLEEERSLLAEAARLDELRLSAIEDRTEALLTLGEHAEVIGELEALTTTYPLRERMWGHLVLALYRGGRQAEALAAFERARQILAEELGIDPSPELRRLHERILHQSPDLEISGSPLRGYRLLERIGAGSFGAVWRALQPEVGRDVAVKAIHAHLANDPDFIRRFETEAQLVARIEHPHVVPLYDYWREPGGAYLVMRYLRGGNLAETIAAGPLDPERIVKLLDQVAGALAAADHQGVVHRDVKPSNILLDEEGNAYLADFGIAKEMSAPDMTEPGLVKGSLEYLAPEQIRGATITPQTDQYALGVILYEMLVGEHPFHDVPSMAVPNRQLHDPLPSARERRRDLPPAVDGVVATATAKDPKLRFPDALAMAAAFRRALTQEDTAPVPAVEIRNPYKGLRPFTEADANDFFGREAFVERLLARWRRTNGSAGETRFLAVVGPSGSGKSSAVRAGLVPALRAGAVDGSAGWFITEMVPGRHPMEELEAALLRIAAQPPAGLLGLLESGPRGLINAADRVVPDGTELVLVVDQFEEIFTLTESESERSLLLESIRVAVADPASRVRVIATLRADFYDRPLNYQRFGELLGAGTEVVTPLAPDELERAIVGPAEPLGLKVEPALVAQVASDVAEQPGALPLVQYALTELFERRGAGAIGLSAYRDIGGVAGALATRAEQLYSARDAVGREAMRQLFLRLVTLGEGTLDTRRRVPLSELWGIELNPEALRSALDAFGRHRLLTFDRDPATREPTVEVAHEALLRSWPRLREWIGAAREDVRTLRVLAAAASEWQLGGREESFLLTGSRLDRFETWASSPNLAIGHPEREYLRASVARREREQAVERTRAAREAGLERRSNRRLRLIVAVLTVAALVAGTLTVIATNQRGRAGRETRVATARELAAASVANLDVDPERSILLALEAIETTRVSDVFVLPEAEEALHRAIGASRIEMSIPGVGGDLDWSSEGVFVTTGNFASVGPHEIGLIDIRDAQSGEIVRSFPADNQGFQHVDWSAEVAFSADGRMLATTGNDGALKVFDQASGDLVSSVSGVDLAFGPSLTSDGSLAAAVWNRVGRPGTMARVVDLSTQRILTLPAPKDANATAFSPDGTRIALAGGDFGGVVWVTDIATGDVRELTNPGPLGLTSVAWSPDGKYVAAGGWGAEVPVWDARGRLRFLLTGHTSSAHWLDWSPDSSALVTGSDDGTARVWEITDHGASELMTLSPQEGRISGVAFSSDGTQVMTGSETSAVDIWDVGPTGDAEWANVPNYGDMTFARGGSELITSSVVDGTVTGLDIDSGQQRPIGRPHPVGDWPAVDHDLSPDGSSIAIRYGYPLSQKLSVRDVATGNELFAVEGNVAGVDWSPSGEYVAVETPGSVSIYDRSGLEVVVLPGVRGQFGPHDLIATFGVNKPIDIWDWRREEVIATLPAISVERLVFDPSGERIATDDLEIWDAASEKVSLRLPYSPPDVTALAFSPDGTRLAVGSSDEVRVFDARSGAELLVLRGHRGSVEVDKVVFSPDGSMLASWADDGTRVWALDIDDLIEMARSEVTRGFTEAECRQYLHLDRCPTSL